MSFCCGRATKAKPDDYWLFLLCGLPAWVFFATASQAASRSLLENAPLIRKVRFPRQLVPLSAVATQLVAFAAPLVGVLVSIGWQRTVHSKGAFHLLCDGAERQRHAGQEQEGRRREPAQDDGPAVRQAAPGSRLTFQEGDDDGNRFTVGRSDSGARSGHDVEPGGDELAQRSAELDLQRRLR